MDPWIKDIIKSYNAGSALEQSSTPPASWYTDLQISQLERHSVFSCS